MTLVRKTFSNACTIGELSVDGKPQCFTLEDCVRPVKVAGKTAIPAGTYEVVVTLSNRFKRPLPLLLNVPNFEGVRIHPGNTAADTEGCILVGAAAGKDVVSNSRAAFEALFAKIKAGTERGKVYIDIVGTRG